MSPAEIKGCSEYAPFQPILTDAGLRQSALTCEQIAPCRLLQTTVYSYIQIKVMQPTPYHVLPDGTHALYFSPRQSWLSGVHRTAFTVPLFEPGEYFGIRFFPAAVKQFFRLDMTEIADQFIDHTQLAEATLEYLTYQIYQQDDVLARVRTCERWLLQHYKPMLPSRFGKVLNYAYTQDGNIKVSELARHAGWSERHLNRAFHYHIGVNTKTFLQIFRLQSLYKHRCLKQENAVSSALNAGYFDQAHCIRETGKSVPLFQREFFDQVMSGFYNQ